MTTKSLTRLLLALLAMAGCEAALLAAGGGRLAGPDLLDPASWPTWLLTRPPEVAVMALLRWAGLMLGAYLLLVTVVGALGRATGSLRLVRATDRVTPPSLRLFLDRLTGMAAAGAVVVGGLAGVTASTGVAAADPAGGPPTTRHGPPITLRGQAGPRPDPLPTTTTTVSAPRPAPIAEEPVSGPPRAAQGHDGDHTTEPPAAGSMPRPPGTTGGTPPTPSPPVAYGTPWSPGGPSPAMPVTPPTSGAGGTGGGPIAPGPPGAQGAPAQPTPGADHGGPSPGAAMPADPYAPAVPAPSAEPGTWEVEPGDHFWSIAERLLTDRWGRRPTPAEVDRYWRALVAANRTRLADPGNPDLLFPGQLLTVPPVPERPAA